MRRILHRDLTAKRVVDCGIAAALLIMFWPVGLAIGCLVRVVLGRPVFFVQTRLGLNAEPFALVKFRTMRAAISDESDGARLTALGRLLRSSSLDELPELWNVLRGDMSLVGPRPLLPQYLERYTPEQARRHEMRPGMTGLAQVSGRNALYWEERLTLDVWYIDHWSLWLDFRILARTLGQVLSRTGINAPGHETMPEFQGTGDAS